MPIRLEHRILLLKPFPERKYLCLLALIAFSACSLQQAEKSEPVPASDGISLAGVLHHDRALNHHDRALNRPHDVELQGKVAYVPGKGGTLALVDVSDPARPKLLSSMVDPVGMEDAETVLPMGDILLLGARDFLAIDVSDPTAPRIKKRISGRPRIDKINGMAPRGDYVLTANKTGYINVFDVSDPANPKLHDALDTKARGGLQSPHDIAAFGDHIAVVDTARNSPANVRVYRIADPESHELLPAGQWKIEGAIPASRDLAFNLQGANRVAVSGRYAFVGAFVADRVGVVDLADPRDLVQVANMPVCDIDATGMAVAGQVLFVSGGECVEAIDVSNPAEPVSIAQYRDGELFPTRRLLLEGEARFDNGHDLVYRDGYLYVTAQNDNRFGILKVNDPRVLELAGAPAAAR